jgi:hypothetical protein
MEPKYTITTDYNFEKYKRFAQRLNDKYNKFTLRIVVTELALLLIGLLWFRSDKNITAIFLISALVFPFVIIYRRNKAIKSTWESNKMAQNAVLEFQFFDDHFIRNTKNSNSYVDYKNIYDILATDDNFYIMMSKNQGYIIDKSDCDKELSQFITSLPKNNKKAK